MTTTELQECLLRGFGYRKTTELRGEYIDPVGGPIINTLHTAEVWVRDRSEQPSNPMNDGNYDACLACGGDGGFDDTYIGTDHEVTSDYRDCRECGGTGRVYHE